MIYDLKNQLSRKRFSTRVKALWEAGAVVELTDKSRRTNKQNAYLHVICGILALETGTTLDYIKQEVFKRRCNPSLFVVEKDDPILGKVSTLRSSRDLNKEEMALAIDRYMMFCSDNGVYIPSPEETDILKEAEYELMRNERWL